MYIDALVKPSAGSSVSRVSLSPLSFASCHDRSRFTDLKVLLLLSILIYRDYKSNSVISVLFRDVLHFSPQWHKVFDFSRSQ